MARDRREADELEALLRADPELAELFAQANDPHAGMTSSDDTPTDRNQLVRRRDDRLQELGLAGSVPEGFGLGAGGEVTELPGFMAKYWPLLAMVGAPYAAQGIGALVGGGGAAGGAGTAGSAAGGSAAVPTLTASSTMPAISGGTAITGLGAPAAGAGAGAGGGAAAGGSMAANAGNASGIMKFLDSPAGLTALSSVLGLFGGDEGIGSFEGAGRNLDPSAVLGRSNQAIAEVGQALSRRLSQPMQSQTPMPGRMTTTGFGQDLPQLSLPGLDLGGLTSLLGQATGPDPAAAPPGVQRKRKGGY